MLGIENFFHIDQLTLIMMALVSFVGLSIASFSSRYLQGDTKRGTFYRNLIVLILNVFILSAADHILVLLFSWAFANYFLSKLMLHKPAWKAAQESSLLAQKNFLTGFIFLSAALCILCVNTGSFSIRHINNETIASHWAILSAALILLAAMTQSALWPFHRWLLSSLNSPTPVSAIMHAGLINGGGFILTRFAPIFFNEPFILDILFILGVVTALLGTLWKLMQSDVKRMLACSTMGQMGFMLAQCGLGLFPAAVAHLCWHGLFKAYLFLSSSSRAQEKRFDLDAPPSLKYFCSSLLCGLMGAYMFATVSEKVPLRLDTNLFLILLAAIAGTQFALSLLRSYSFVRFPFVLIATMLAGSLYGFSVESIERLLAPLDISRPQTFSALHIFTYFFLLSAWLAVVFSHQEKQNTYPSWVLKFYVRMLNASQAHSKTITANRNQYQS
ncbi:MAG: proton-conducting membrane transporter [Waddliaceae bacterium]|nr:proton-conducting membrane transporter [Waddliaceae bacterium]